VSAQFPDLREVTPFLRPPRLAVGLPASLSPLNWKTLLSRATMTWGGLDGTMYFAGRGEFDPLRPYQLFEYRTVPRRAFLTGT